MRTAGIVTVIAGGLVFVAALALLAWVNVIPELSSAGSIIEAHGVTLWHLRTRQPGVMTVIAGAAIALATMSLLTDSVLAVLAPTCCSFWLLGEVFPVGALNYSVYGVGFWVALAAAGAMSIGGVLSVAGTASPRNRLARPR